jgi:glycosyltransferase involved in cell wall biosynthesis
MTRLPRVVGIMPTYNRPGMAHRAVHLFLEQDYEGDGLLLVYDDGERKFEPCSTCRSKIDLVQHDKLELPVKRNRMIERDSDPHAIYVNWDDDDYHGPGRVRRQVEAITSAPPWMQACILRPTLYYNSLSGELATSNWLSDGTIAHTFDFWRLGAYTPGIDPGCGRRFVQPRMKEIVTIDGDLDYCVVVHADQRHTPPAFGPPDFTAAPVGVEWITERLRLR